VLLQPGESVTAARTFEVAADAHPIGLVPDNLLPVCPIIGECGAFHKATILKID
jgi:hypothetical protein